MDQIKTNKIKGAKYNWILPEIKREDVLDTALSYNISFSIIQTLYNRGYNTRESIDSYLFSSFEKDVAHPSLLKDANKAVDRILKAIKNQEKILICGDYDVDGITSSAMMLTCLTPLDAKINFFLPNRVKDGYGLSKNIVKKAAKNNYKIIITVDNGITSFQAAQEAKELGIDLIITDHHKPHEQLPEAYAIINPHQVDCFYPFKKLAGVGVTFKLLYLLYESLNKSLPEKVYELLTLGTIADVVSLTGENRFWVRHGLKFINTKESLPVTLLKKNTKLTKTSLSSLDIGFFLAPQINALGRLEDARQGVRFLLSANIDEVSRVAVILKEFNEARKSIEKKILNEIIELVESNKINLEQERIILASSKNWQAGVIGLVASRIVGLYNRPVLLFCETNQGLAKGSCRSISDFNIFDALTEHKDILASFGGHAMAAGLALPIEKLGELKNRLELSISQKIPVFEPKPNLNLDAEIFIGEVNKKLISDLQYLEPFGNENHQPIFYLKNISIIGSPILLKNAHVKCMIFSEGVIKPIIFFNRPDIYDILLEHKDKTISMAAYVTENHFNGQISIEFQGVDVAL